MQHAPTRITLARHAMATRFEFVLAGSDRPDGPNATQLRAAGEEALDEIERIEGRLSLYRPGSEIAQINARAAFEPVRLSPEVFALLTQASAFHALTQGTFDPTIGPLVRCWGFMKTTGALPALDDIAAARELTGFHRLHFDEENSSVRFERPGMMLDLGSIGKGYALDRAAEILRDSGVENALLHGGTSTIVAFGHEPGLAGWKIAIDHPQPATDSPTLAVVELHDESLSVSAIWGKSFQLEGKTFGHVIDPRTGWPADSAQLGAVILDSAIATDALSTAILLGQEDDLHRLVLQVPALRYLQLKNTAPLSILAHRFPHAAEEPI